jgi:hypothetical protein
MYRGRAVYFGLFGAFRGYAALGSSVAGDAK